MTDFSDIRASFARLREAEYRYWDNLSSVAWTIVIGLEEHLGLKGQRAVIPGKSAERYFQAGNVENGQFKEVNGPFFNGEDLKLIFAVRLILDAGPDALPKEGVIINFSIMPNANSYEVEFEVVDGAIKVPIAKDLKGDELSALYERVAFEVIHKLDPSPYL